MGIYKWNYQKFQNHLQTITKKLILNHKCENPKCSIEWLKSVIPNDELVDVNDIDYNTLSFNNLDTNLRTNIVLSEIENLTPKISFKNVEIAFETESKDDLFGWEFPAKSINSNIKIVLRCKTCDEEKSYEFLEIGFSSFKEFFIDIVSS